MKIDICIPTYNRCEELLLNIENIEQYIQNSEHDIKIIISDNCSVDRTFEMLLELKKRYNNIECYTNILNEGSDKNIAKVLSLSNADYAWLLGSDDTFYSPFNNILNEIDVYNPSIVVLGNDYSIEEKIYTDYKEIFEKIFSETTWISGLIIKVDVIKKLNFMKYVGTWFVQAGAIFEYIALSQTSLMYKHNKVVRLMNPGSISYTDKILEIYIKAKVDLIFKLPEAYSLDEKIKKLKRETLPISGFLSLRARGAFNYENFCKYRQMISIYTSTPKIMLIFVISIFPKSILYVARKIYIHIFHINEIKQG